MTNQTTERTLVLGATGSFGGAVLSELLERGQQVRALVRDPAKLASKIAGATNLQIVVGDVQNVDDLSEAADGCHTIVHGVNYSYDQWFPHMETANQNIIAAARANAATIVFPGNIYSLGSAGAEAFSETAPHTPSTKKGELRQWMENELKAYAESGGRVLIVRAGDYFGPTVRNGLVDPAFSAAVSGKPMMVLGNMNIPHQWAYVPDLARATVDLMNMDDSLKPYEVVHFEGTIARPQRQFFAHLARQANAPDKIRRVPWWVLKMMGLASPIIREVVGMRYIWDTCVLIEGPRFAELLPSFKSTSLDQAYLDTLESYRLDTAVDNPADDAGYHPALSQTGNV